MARHFDFSQGSWEFDDHYDRSQSREPRQPARHLSAADYNERAARILGAAFTTTTTTSSAADAGEVGE